MSSTLLNLSPLLSAVAQHPNKPLHLEVRFGSCQDSSYVNGISRSDFYRMLDLFRTRAPPVHTVSTDYLRDNIRRTVVLNRPDVWTVKDRIYDQPTFGLCITLNTVMTIQPVPSFQPTVIRTKNRYSFPIFNGLARLDLTMSETDLPSSRRADQSAQYEMEIHLLDLTHLAKLPAILTPILQAFYETTELYTPDERSRAFQAVNRLFNTPRLQLSRPRPLQLDDLTYGRMVGGTKTYSVSYKVVGSRRLLALLESGIWLLSPTGTATRLSTTTPSAVVGTVLDGDLIPKTARRAGAPTSTYWLTIFDCLAYQGSSDVQAQRHYRRMIHAQQIVDLLALFNPRLLALNTKTFTSLDTVADFFLIHQRLFENEPNLAYQIEGLVYMPNQSLTRPPTIWIWKNFTVKLQTRRAGREETDLYADDQLVARVELIDQPTGTIVEFEWTGQWFPVRVRHDLTRSDTMITVDQYRQTVAHPITRATLQGQSFDLVNRFHQRLGGVTLDQRCVEQLMDPPLGGTVLSQLKLGSRILDYTDGTFFVDGKKWPLVVGKGRRIEDELFLSEPELIWNRLFVLGAQPPPVVETVAPVTPLLVLEDGTGDDAIQVFPLPLEETVYRLASLGPFIHAYFKGFYDTYQNTDSKAERLALVQEVYPVDFIVLRWMDGQLRVVEPTERKSPWTVVVVDLNGHYETVGVDRMGGIQTVFRHEDEFLTSMRQRLNGR